MPAQPKENSPLPLQQPLAPPPHSSPCHDGCIWQLQTEKSTPPPTQEKKTCAEHKKGNKKELKIQSLLKNLKHNPIELIEIFQSLPQGHFQNFSSIK